MDEMESMKPARSETGQWEKGTSGNPAGRPPGSRNRAAVIVEDLFEGEAEILARRAIDLALAGNPSVLKLCLERIAPPQRQRTIRLDMAGIDDLAGVGKAASSVFQAVGEGVLTPEEAETLVRMLALRSEMLEREDLERRIAALEKAADEKGAEERPEES